MAIDVMLLGLYNIFSAKLSQTPAPAPEQNFKLRSTIELVIGGQKS